MRFSIRAYWSGAALMALPALAHATAELPAVRRVPLDFISLACTLLGFATRCAHDENSRVPAWLPTFPRDAGRDASSLCGQLVPKNLASLPSSPTLLPGGEGSFMLPATRGGSWVGGLMAIRKASGRHATEKSRSGTNAALSATQPSTYNSFVSI